MGLLEKAGQIQTDGPKPAAKKAKKPRKTKKRAKATIEDEFDDLDLEDTAPRTSRDLPDEFVLASKPARFALSLIDFIVTYVWLIAILGFIGFVEQGNFNPTYFYMGGSLLMIFNLVALPFMTNRTIGNFVSMTKFVTHTGRPPIFLHSTLRGLNFGFLAGGVIGLLIGIPIKNSVILGIAAALLAIFVGDWVMKKVRHEKQQGLYDTLFNAYLVAHVRTGDEEGWLGRLESLADFGESRLKLGDEEDDEGEGEDDDEAESD